MTNAAVIDPSDTPPPATTRPPPDANAAPAPAAATPPAAAPADPAVGAPNAFIFGSIIVTITAPTAGGNRPNRRAHTLRIAFA
ncbi:hypothetical protein ACQEVF_57950 [Nonomuraea polychroma]|uniref:hypothetical protein n=1 Tax=Nonomuraea polychroma TaxID=46176 RepID=UPI003D946255